MKVASLIIGLLALMGFTGLEKKKIKVWLIGDSTMSVKDKKAYPETGWGMPFVNFWDSTVTIDNRAKNGRSSKSFMAENLWKPVVDNLQEGDYVFIQFGHNDESKDKGDRYSSPDEFKANLLKYVNDSRAKKAIPILITPVARRKFDEAGHVKETHEEYAALVRQVASENKVILIDLDAISQLLLQSFGPDASKYLFNYLSPGEHPNYPDGKQDDTHFSELGARKMAEIVLSEIRALKLELAERIYVPVVKK
jgi:lysophospholipase L1-like esterase